MDCACRAKFTQHKPSRDGVIETFPRPCASPSSGQPEYPREHHGRDLDVDPRRTAMRVGSCGSASINVDAIRWGFASHHSVCKEKDMGQRQKRVKGYWAKLNETFDNGTEAKSRAGHLRNRGACRHVTVDKADAKYRRVLFRREMVPPGVGAYWCQTLGLQCDVSWPSKFQANSNVTRNRHRATLAYVRRHQLSEFGTSDGIYKQVTKEWRTNTLF